MIVKVTEWHNLQHHDTCCKEHTVFLYHNSVFWPRKHLPRCRICHCSQQCKSLAEIRASEGPLRPATLRHLYFVGNLSRRAYLVSCLALSNYAGTCTAGLYHTAGLFPGTTKKSNDSHWDSVSTDQLPHTINVMQERSSMKVILAGLDQVGRKDPSDSIWWDQAWTYLHIYLCPRCKFKADDFIWRNYIHLSANPIEAGHACSLKVTFPS